MRLPLAAVALAALACGAHAQAPDSVLRPEARANGPTVAATSPRPLGRPAVDSASPAEPEGPSGIIPGAVATLRLLGPPPTSLAPASAPLPRPRPGRIVEQVDAARAEAARGQVCGDPRLQGEALSSIGSGGGCGVDDPVRLRSVDGVAMAGDVTVDCVTADALLGWVRDAARPALASRGGGLAALEVMGSYACRPRNNQAGARLSEHGRGRAVDIGGLRLADGSRLSVLEDWPDPALRAMHRAACGPFSTVLGPEANAQHRNHFHFDTARGRGPYCR